jgi:hypothetical protein
MNKAENRDIMSFQAFPEYDIIWCDPPWEDKMVKYFQTLNHKQTGKVVENNINGILEKLFLLANNQKPIVVEYSIKGSELVIEYAKKHGHTLTQTVTAIQDNDLKSYLLVFNTDVRLEQGLRGYLNTTEGVRKLGAKLVFDPFAGMGRTAKAVLLAGASYHGSELNEARYKKLCKILSV